jgi:oligopeptide/dipeptide ABC transporter ATP-binding protein
MNAHKKELGFIPGTLPDLMKLPEGCKFNPRCPHQMEICLKKKPELEEVKEGHFAACHLYST